VQSRQEEISKHGVPSVAPQAQIPAFFRVFSCGLHMWYLCLGTILPEHDDRRHRCLQYTFRSPMPMVQFVDLPFVTMSIGSLDHHRVVGRAPLFLFVLVIDPITQAVFIIFSVWDGNL